MTADPPRAEGGGEVPVPVAPSIHASLLRTVPPRRYCDFKPVGAGGMGIVYWALDTEMNRAVAFKVVRPPREDGTSEPPPPVPTAVTPPPRGSEAAQTFSELKTRFLQEAWVTGGMEHPGVVPVYEMGQTAAGVPYYTMRFVKGGRSLADAITEGRKAPADERLRLLEPFLKVCDAIRYAHARGVIHRDLKPDNVALGEFGEAVVLDWGLAKMKQAPDVTGSRWQARVREFRETTEVHTHDSAMGTPGYMSPEAAMGDVEAMDERSDVHSLGAMLFEILTGRLPFQFRSFLEYVRLVTTTDPPPAREVDPAVPEALSALCARALARERSQRTASVDDLAAGIRAWQAQSAIDREVDSLLKEARAAVEASPSLAGDALLQRIEGARSALAQVARLKPGLPETDALLARVRELGDRGLLERERQVRRRLVRRIAVAALVVLTAGGIAVAMLLDARRREAEESAVRARTAERVASEERDRANQEKERANQERDRANQERDRANQEKDRADREAEETRVALHHARVLSLVNASAEATHTDPMLALLLAREAATREATPASLSRLQEALTSSREETIYWGTGSPLSMAAISPDGELVLTGADDGTVKLFRRWRGAEVATLPGHTGAVVQVAWSDDGQRVATASLDGTVRVFDAEGRPVAVLEGHGDGATAVAFGPKAEFVVTGARDGLARVFGPDGKVLAALRGHDERVNAVRVSPDGTRVLTASADGTARLFDRDGRQVAVLRGHEGNLYDAAISPVGDLVATASEDGTARLWNLEGAEVAVLEGHARAVNAVAFSPDGAHVLTGSSDRTARLWKTDGTPVATCAGHESFVLCVAFYVGGGTLVTGSADYSVRLWNLQGQPEGVLRGHLLNVNSVQWNPTGAGLLSASADGTARLWDYTAEACGTFRAHRGTVYEVSFTDAEHVLTASGDGKARLWNRAGTEFTGFEGHDGMVVWAGASPRGDRVLTTSADGTARLWNLEGKALVAFRGHGAMVTHAAFSPAGDRVVTVSSDSTGRIWDLSGSALRVLKGHDGTVQGVVWSEDGRIHTVGADQRVVHWDADGNQVGSFDLPAQGLAIACDRRGERFVVGLSDHTARVYDPEGDETAVLRGHTDWVFGVAFSPRGDLVATGALDRTARVWDLSGSERMVLRGHEGGLYAVAFDPAGGALVTGAEDGMGRLWELEPARLLEVAAGRSTRELTDLERTRYADLLAPDPAR